MKGDWKPALGKSLLAALCNGKGDGHLDLGCVAASGYFGFDENNGEYATHIGGKPTTAFMSDLISWLQSNGKVQMIDVQAYAQWISDSTS